MLAGWETTYPTQPILPFIGDDMFDLRNYLWNSDYGTSAHLELALLVAAFGMDAILHSLAEISSEQRSWIRRKENGREVITMEGKDYILP